MLLHVEKHLGPNGTRLGRNNLANSGFFVFVFIFVLFFKPIMLVMWSMEIKKKNTDFKIKDKAKEEQAHSKKSSSIFLLSAYWTQS